jgi:hypothetical protein
MTICQICDIFYKDLQLVVRRIALIIYTFGRPAQMMRITSTLTKL